MKPLSARSLLDVWEQGIAHPPLYQALLLLAAAWPDMAWQSLTELSLGHRDHCLLTLREWTFGPQLASQATCPPCGEILELQFTISDIRQQTGTVQMAETFTLEKAGYQVQFRLPNSLDLLTLAQQPGQPAADQWLLKRCLIEIDHPEQAPAEALPDHLVEAIAEQMAQADPLTDLRIGLTCPACNHHWELVFDIVTFFWQEIENWAVRTLREVHTLALNYGWSEADILSMSAWKRNLYLQMVNG